MALVVKDRVRETTTTTGTGTVTLAGAVGGYRSFADIGNGNTTYYAIVGGSEWEVGIGTYTAVGTTLSRDTVLSNSLGTTALITFSAGSKDVFVTYPSTKSIYQDASNNVTFTAGLSATSITNSGLTSGRVTFASTGGLLADSANLFWDNSNARLGIGTASPATALHIFSSTQPTARLASTTYSMDILVQESTNIAALRTNTATPITFLINSLEKMRLDTSGNLGLGVTPSAWNSVIKSMQLGQGAAIESRTNSYSYASISANQYINSGGSNIYIGTDYATKYDQASGSHRWFNAPSGTGGTVVTFTQAMTLDASGRLLVGLTSANTSGAKLQTVDGITFPATQVASADANTLDDYEEGTFTPTIVGTTTAGTGTYNSNIGRYTKIGDIVYFQIWINMTAHTGTGNMYLTGLPFTSNSTAGYSGLAGVTNYGTLTIPASALPFAYVPANTTQVTLASTATAAAAPVALALDTAFTLAISGFYKV